MTNDLDTSDDTSGPSAGDRARARAYLLDFVPSMIGYGLVLVGVLRWGHLDGHSPWRFVWSVLPVLPVLWIGRAVLRHLRRVDDYQRLLLLNSLAAGFAIAMIAAVTVGLLGIAGVPMRSAGWVVFGAGMLGWLVAGQRLARR